MPGAISAGFPEFELREYLLRSGRGSEIASRIPLQNDATVAADELDRGKAAEARLIGQVRGDRGRVCLDVRRHTIELAGDRQKIEAQHAAVLLHVGLGHGARRVDDRLGAAGEPAVEAFAQRDRGDHHHEDRRECRDEREEENDPHVQAGGGASAAARDPQPRRLVSHDPDQEEDDQSVDDAGTAHDERRRLDRGLPGQDQEGADGRGDSCEHHDQAKGARHATPVGQVPVRPLGVRFTFGNGNHGGRNEP